MRTYYTLLLIITHIYKPLFLQINNMVTGKNYTLPPNILINIRNYNDKYMQDPNVDIYKLIENEGVIRHILPLGFFSLSDFLKNDPTPSLESLIKEIKKNVGTK